MHPIIPGGKIFAKLMKTRAEVDFLKIIRALDTIVTLFIQPMIQDTGVSFFPLCSNEDIRNKPCEPASRGRSPSSQGAITQLNPRT